MCGGSFGHFLHALDEGAERFHLCPEEQISKLRVGEEHDEEHDSEAQDVLSTSTQCGGQLSHGLVKADVLEDLKENRQFEPRIASSGMCSAGRRLP